VQFTPLVLTPTASIVTCSLGFAKEAVSTFALTPNGTVYLVVVVKGEGRIR